MDEKHILITFGVILVYIHCVTAQPACQTFEPCLHGATCENGGTSIYDGFTCLCALGFSGRNCETQIQEVSGNTFPQWAGNSRTVDVEDDTSDTIEIECVTGYGNAGSVLDRSYTLTLNTEAIWTGNGMCKDIDECKGSDACSPDATCTNVPGSYLCECKPGFTGDGKYCTGAKCERLPYILKAAPLFTSSGTEMNYGDSVIFRCETGTQIYTYGIPGGGQRSFQLNCVEGGKWAQLPGLTCEAVFCGDPGYVSHATKTKSSMTYPSSIEYQCFKGHHIGSSKAKSFSRTCQENGEWTESYGCVDIDECNENPSICDDDKDCSNFPGGYLCTQTLSPQNNDLTSGGLCEISRKLGLCVHGSCTMDNNQAFCKCADGYHGNACDIKIDDGTFMIALAGLVISSLLITIVGVGFIIRACFQRPAPFPVPAPPSYDPYYGKGLRFNRRY